MYIFNNSMNALWGNLLNHFFWVKNPLNSILPNVLASESKRCIPGKAIMGIGGF